MPRRLLALCLASLPLLSPQPAHADDRATAQLLFQQGKELMRGANYVEACPKFEAAAQYANSPGVRLNLADCWTKLGRTASAWAKYDEALVAAEQSGDAAAAAIARKGKTDLEPLLVHLSIVVGTDAAVPGLVVRRDGEKLPNAAWNVPFPVDPGEHNISAEAPGRVPWSATQAVMDRGSNVSVVVPVLPEGVVAQGQLAVPPGTVVTVPVGAKPNDLLPPPTPTVSNTQRIAGWVTAGAGVVGLAIGAGFAGVAGGDKSDYQALQTSSGACKNAQCAADSDSAFHAGTVSTVGFIVGGVLAAGGVVLILTAPKAEHPVATALTPVLSPTSAGLGISGSF